MLPTVGLVTAAEAKAASRTVEHIAAATRVEK
jgi:hypothetical protein